LERSGYVVDTQQADVSRGRYRNVKSDAPSIEIEPSKYALIDGQKVFPRIRVLFSRSGKAVASISDLDNGARLNKALLEPELLSSVAGKLREKRRVVGFKDLPPHLVKAITVTEDRSFFEHHGINIRGIIRALIRRYDTDPNSPISRQGGSSITQQLVKNLLLSPERTLKRKLSEAYMSVILETRLSKEDIFALYCNEVYLGQQAGFSIDGVGEASEAYFNKDVTAVTLPEAAYIAGLIRSPNRYNPYKNPETATARRNQVLESMAEEGVISREEADQAKVTNLNVLPGKGRIDASDAPYFADFVEQQLSSIGADETSAQHLRIYTTIDIDLQRAAYTAVTKQLNALDKVFAKKISPGTVQAALVAMDANTGEIIAMVGGRDYEKSQLNRVTEALRQTGSVYKPFVYAAALESAYETGQRVITPATTFMDAPQTFNYDGREYSPGNFGDKYTNQMMTLRDALVDSKNVITVQVAMEVSMARVVSLATRAGIPKPQYLNPALALGAGEATPLQVASAYTAFATGGSRVTSVAIKKITTGKGKLVTGVAPPPAHKNQVLRPDVAYVMTSFMKDVIERGTAAKIRARGFKFNVAGKTGTSRDGWFAGFTPNIVCVVWVGFDDGKQLGLTGASSALPIWADFMTAA
ncbi:MAG: transglycosylase domain-containing protein, partial [Pyrinomonadaceae bacterium]